MKRKHGLIGDSSPDTIPLVVLRVTYVKSFGCRLSHVERELGEVGRGGEWRWKGGGVKRKEGRGMKSEHVFATEGKLRTLFFF